MDPKDSLVRGSVLIVHQVNEGKHHYQVDNVVKKASGVKPFVRKGDKLMQINGRDLQDFTPKELAEAIAEGNPMLTVHKSGRLKKPSHNPVPSEETLHPVSKETTVLQFSMEMVREEVSGDSEGRPKDRTDVCPAENTEQEKDLLVVAMMKTSISVVRGRGCSSESMCGGCHGTGCTLNDMVIVAESSTVTLVPRGGAKFQQEKMLNTQIEHVMSNQYIRSVCPQKTPFISSSPVRMTIYYYKTNTVGKNFPGQPVVLNFTDSDCFLRCCKRDERVLLEVETYEKQKLREISNNDDSTLSFLFYMKANRSKQRMFESALHSGWFIQIDNSVEMAQPDGPHESYQFLFIIEI
ncbi:uncharacterized protein ACBR49_006426 [Aulostomus maculatus]